MNMNYRRSIHDVIAKGMGKNLETDVNEVIVFLSQVEKKNPRLRSIKNKDYLNLLLNFKPGELTANKFVTAVKLKGLLSRGTIATPSTSFSDRRKRNSGVKKGPKTTPKNLGGKSVKPNRCPHGVPRGMPCAICNPKKFKEWYGDD